MFWTKKQTNKIRNKNKYCTPWKNSTSIQHGIAFHHTFRGYQHPVQSCTDVTGDTFNLDWAWSGYTFSIPIGAFAQDVEGGRSGLRNSIWIGLARNRKFLVWLGYYELLAKLCHLQHTATMFWFCESTAWNLSGCTYHLMSYLVAFSILFIYIIYYEELAQVK